MDDPCKNTIWKYDTRGRLTEELKTINGSGSFKTQWGYNAADQVTWMKYPGGNASQVGEQVSYTYHTQGALDSVTAGSTTYVRRTIYDASGRVELRELGWNGSSPTVKVDYDYFAWDTPKGQRDWINHQVRSFKMNRFSRMKTRSAECVGLAISHDNR